MALDKNPRRFILYVNEIDGELLPGQDFDEVRIVFAGKVMPSTKERLYKALKEDGPELLDKVLT